MSAAAPAPERGVWLDLEAAHRASRAAFERGRYYEQGVQLGSRREAKAKREKRALDRGFALLDGDRRDGARHAAALLQGYTDATLGVA